ncbi:MAG: hypothetical protein R3F65_03470 [bacterium]
MNGVLVLGGVVGVELAGRFDLDAAEEGVAEHGDGGSVPRMRRSMRTRGAAAARAPANCSGLWQRVSADAAAVGDGLTATGRSKEVVVEGEAVDGALPH